MVCSTCHSRKMRRIMRKGFLRVKLAPLFGYYPWRCSVCRKEELLKVRGYEKRSSHTVDQLSQTSAQSAD
jgi:hypothetical protein